MTVRSWCSKISCLHIMRWDNNQASDAKSTCESFTVDVPSNNKSHLQFFQADIHEDGVDCLYIKQDFTYAIKNTSKHTERILAAYHFQSTTSQWSYFDTALYVFFQPQRMNSNDWLFLEDLEPNKSDWLILSFNRIKAMMYDIIQCLLYLHIN